MMKKMIISVAFVCLFVSSSQATYTYEIYTYGPSKLLDGNESILVAEEGGMNGLTLFDNSSADINGTSTLGDGTGGIWVISLAESSSLNMVSGEVNLLSLNNNATALLSGGYIGTIWSQQSAWKFVDGPLQWVPDPHITIVYSGDLPTVDASNVLTGLWEDGSVFSIHLHDVEGYSPAIENIQFIPEPMSLLLMGIGAIALRRRKV